MTGVGGLYKTAGNSLYFIPLQHDDWVFQIFPGMDTYK